MISIPEGTYIVAVSGGVDSMVLLDMLRTRSGLKLIVAHVNHGIRTDSNADQKLVTSFCMSHNIMYVDKVLHLGPHASEAEARRARYEFLQSCRVNFKANAILTAHHQDDLVETALLNILRGTQWRGIAPFVGSPTILRPLLQTPKSELMAYARTHAIPWREDTTNSDQRYARNYIRKTIVPALDELQRQWQSTILRLIRNQQQLRRKIEGELNRQLTSMILSNDNCLVSRRHVWIMLPPEVSYELFQALCRRHLGHSLVVSLAEAALLFIKTAKPDKRMPLNTQWQLRATLDQIIVEPSPVVIS